MLVTHLSMGRIVKFALVSTLVIFIATVAYAERKESPYRDLLIDFYYAEVVGKESNDRQILEALYHATDGDSWTRRDGWLTETPIGEWYGVKERSGRVRMLDLSNNNLSGSLPPELSELKGLRSLDLRWNSLTGTLPDLSEVRVFKRLLLTDNEFAGEIPTWIGKIYDMERLDLSHNKFSGHIPEELGMLSNLQSLALHHNNLEGPIPSGFSKLRHLNLSNNRLSGSVPEEILRSKTLEWLDLRQNSIDPGEESFHVAMPDYYEIWTLPEDGTTDLNHKEASNVMEAKQSIAMDMWGQTSEVIENPKIRSYVFEYLMRMDVRNGHLRLHRGQLPVYIRIGNIQEVVSTINSHLKANKKKISTPSDMERWFEALEGQTRGYLTVEPFNTNRPVERVHEDRVLADGTAIHVDGIRLTGIYAVWKKRREDCLDRQIPKEECGGGILPYRASEDF